MAANIFGIWYAPNFHHEHDLCLLLFLTKLDHGNFSKYLSPVLVGMLLLCPEFLERVMRQHCVQSSTTCCTETHTTPHWHASHTTPISKASIEFVKTLDEESVVFAAMRFWQRGQDNASWGIDCSTLIRAPSGRLVVINRKRRWNSATYFFKLPT